MAPQLVVANAAYTAYPGGVVALRCSDWMGGARGTLSSEADARSAAGTVVRDSQQVTTAIRTNANGAFQEADNTLVIDFASLPLQVDMTYLVLVSCLIEGDWDPTDSETTRNAHQELFAHACALRWYGDTVNYLSDTDTAQINLKARALDSYRVFGFAGQVHIGDVVGSEVLYWRAYAQDGTSIEWLIDQIYFVPNVVSGTKADEWRVQDFKIVAGSAGTFGQYSLSNGAWVDGADGGDANGKFTWHPVPQDSQTDNSTEDGGGDYQKDDSEYMVRLVPDDDKFLSNSENVYPDNEPNGSRCYGIHGPFYVPAQEWVNDPFTRTAGTSSYGNFGDPEFTFDANAWNTTPQGFFWTGAVNGPYDWTSVPFGNHRHGCNIWTDGSRGGMSVIWDGDLDLQHHAGATLGTNGTAGARIACDNIIISGECTPEQVQAPTSGGGASYVFVDTGFGNGLFGSETATTQSIKIRFDIIARSWSLIFTFGTTIIYGPIDVSGWWSPGDTFGFRLEIKRYLVRVRVWDASGAEPGTWDYEDFRPIVRSGVVKNYPYQTAGIDDLNWALLESDIHTCTLWHQPQNDHGQSGIYNVMFDNVVVENDPYGTNESAWALMEQPEGTQVAQIEIPAGCQHLVFWGNRDWTTMDPGGPSGAGPYIEFSAKVWNDAGAAELQRSEAVWWWFRSAHDFIIPMNWRSSTREGGWKRVLRGYE